MSADKSQGPQYRVVKLVDTDALQVVGRAALYPEAVALLQKHRLADPEARFNLVVVMRV